MRNGRQLCSLLGVMLAVAATSATGCGAAEGLLPAMPAEVTVKLDFEHRPLPDIPLPNDIATRWDPESRTGKRINASMVAPTALERRTRRLIDGLDGWGVYQPISVPFTGPIDPMSVVERHREADYDPTNDAIYLIDIDRDSPDFGRVHHLDVGNGNYPVVLERLDNYGRNDPRGWALSIIFDEEDEDLDGDGELDPGNDANGNGRIDPGETPPEDTDADGVLDRPNYLPGHSPARDDMMGRADALMSFYERETNTLLVAPMMPLRERTRYAVVVTRRILDTEGNPVGSPYAYVNHAAQTEELEPLLEVLPDYLPAEEIAFAFSYTTESITNDWISVREGLYGYGPQAHLAEQYPPDLVELLPLRSTGPGEPFEGRTPFVLHHEDWKDLLPLLLGAFLGQADPFSQQQQAMFGSHEYVDFHAMGMLESPQLFDRLDDEGNPLPLDEQSWPDTLDTEAVDARSELMPFWLTVPRKEISARGNGEMTPIVILGHGYGSNRAVELVSFGGFLAMYGISVIGIDNVSHGPPIEPDTLEQGRALLAPQGLEPALEALALGRAQDLNGDGVVDSGVDFWTSYLFHMRDMVRQSAVDYMQLIRIIKTWDGTKRWPFDIDGDGQPDLAGDFDGDGFVDIGSESPIYVVGGSLGGIMATVMGSVEPHVDGIIPIAGGGRITDVGNRSLQGGVPQAVFLRVMGPLFLLDAYEDGRTEISTEVVELNDDKIFPITTLTDRPSQAWDTFYGVNLDNGEVDCGYLIPEENPGDTGVVARARIAIPSDKSDRLELRIYDGPVLVTGSDECELVEDPGEPRIIDTMEQPLDGDGNPRTIDGEIIEAGELRALAEGYGLHRTRPELRRFMGLAQMVVDPTDPGVLARHLAAEPLEYPSTGERSGAGFLIVTTIGDMNVPANAGITVGRAAGVIDHLNPDPRYGIPTNQVLLDTWTAEAVNTLGRVPYGSVPPSDSIRDLLGLDATLGSHVDVENFSGGNDIWGEDMVRLDPGLGLIMQQDVNGVPLDGWSGSIFPMLVPEGRHGFVPPGEMTDWAIAICRELEGAAAASCQPDAIAGEIYDVGWAMFHTFGAWATSGRQENPLDWARCWSKDACGNVAPTPQERPASELP